MTLTRAPAALSPDAQAALDQGLSAAKLQEWSVAIRCFNQARAAAPDAPEPLFNLGLAESQIKGRELRAICWFEAYLALVPNAANAADVRKQISDLEIRSEGNADQLIEMLKAIAGKAPSYTSSDIPGLLAESGDMEGAEQIVQNLQAQPDKDSALAEMAEGLRRAGKIKEALAEEAKISDVNSKDRVLAHVADVEIATGLFSLAAEVINQISDNDLEFKFRESSKLARAEFTAGRRDEAFSALESMRGEISKLNTPSGKSTLAATEFELGQKEEAQTELRQVRELIATQEEHKNRMESWGALAVALNDMGRKPEALDAMNSAQDELNAAERAKETFILPNLLFLPSYFPLHDWDDAQTWVREYWSNNSLERAAEMKAIDDAKRATTIDAAKDAALLLLRDPTSNPIKRAQAWTDYINTCLSLPLFTNFDITVAGLEQGLPKEADTEFIFDHVETPALELLDRLGDIRTLRAVSQPLGNVPAETKGP
jgi:tetratricopeptide (TPR) repeat protein